MLLIVKMELSICVYPMTVPRRTYMEQELVKIKHNVYKELGLMNDTNKKRVIKISDKLNTYYDKNYMTTQLPSKELFGGNDNKINGQNLSKLLDIWSRKLGNSQIMNNNNSQKLYYHL